jgi:hypothetical protein
MPDHHIMIMMDRPSFAPAPRNLKSSMPNSGNDGQKGAAAASVRDETGGSAALLPSLLALLERGRASGPMVEALESLRSALLCPLCLGVFRSPATSGCGHSFCQPCIDRHSADHSLCPGTRALALMFLVRLFSPSPRCGPVLAPTSSHARSSSCLFFFASGGVSQSRGAACR